uniref:Uncharacterized protein n=1 Tax=viral metagenome TaxID=1070528 RepID=A0A2V0RA09_9ZZZZ
MAGAMLMIGHQLASAYSLRDHPYVAASMVEVHSMRYGISISKTLQLFENGLPLQTLPIAQMQVLEAEFRVKLGKKLIGGVCSDLFFEYRSKWIPTRNRKSFAYSFARRYLKGLRESGYILSIPFEDTYKRDAERDIRYCHESEHCLYDVKNDTYYVKSVSISRNKTMIRREAGDVIAHKMQHLGITFWCSGWDEKDAFRNFVQRRV